MKRRSIMVQAAIYAAILSACGGGDKVEPPIEISPQLGGIWRGTATDSVSPLTPRDIVILTTDDGQFRITSSDAVQAEGTVTLRQDDDGIDNLEGSVTAFFSDGAETSQCTISAVLVEKSSISGSYSCNNSAAPDSADTGIFTADYDSLYDQGSSATATQGIWANGELEINIDADGSIIDGQFANGCVITDGAISPIDIDFNLYSLNMTFDLTEPPDGTCAELSGFYTGLAFRDVNSGTKTLTFQVDNGTEIFTHILTQPQLGGIWRGTATDSVSALTPRDIVILTTDDGQFRLTSSFAIQAEGTVTLRQDDDDIDNLEGSVTAFAPQGFFFSDGAETSQCAISAVLVAKSSISGSYSCNNSAAPDSADTGIFTADYDSLYDQGSSATATQGIWANGELEINIDADGSIIDGQFANGCVITDGAISPIDIDFNLYSLNMTFDLTAPPDGTCAELSGFYTGLAFRDVNSGVETLTFQVDNGTEIFTDILTQ